MSKHKRNPDDQAKICKRFKESLEFLNLTPSNSYKRLGYKTPSTLYSVISGKCLPDMVKLIALSKFKKTNGDRINIDWLVTGNGPRAYSIKTNKKAKIEKILATLPEKKLEAVSILFENSE